MLGVWRVGRIAHPYRTVKLLQNSAHCIAHDGVITGIMSSMKSAAFEYQRVTSVAQACALLAEHGADAKLIAGGQSLVPMMAMRLARPAVLIDIGRIADLQGITVCDEGVRIGATTRQAHVQAHALVQRELPLLIQAMRWVGHVQTRNRGTLGGSIVHADPSAEIPLVAAVLEATLELQDANGSSELSASEFFYAPMVTAIAPDQCLVAVRFPVWRDARVGSAFDEISIRHGDFALASACAQVALDAAGVVTRCVVGVGGAAPIPQALPEVAAQLVGQAAHATNLDALAAAAAAALDPEGDLHASAEYRRHLAQVLLGRVLRAACENAKA